VWGGNMSIDANNATAQDFENAAQGYANSSWRWFILAAVIFYFFNWWAIIPLVFGIFAVVQSIGSTKQAGHLRGGTYTIPNPNNGAPDGNASNNPTSEI